MTLPWKGGLPLPTGLADFSQAATRDNTADKGAFSSAFAVSFKALPVEHPAVSAFPVVATCAITRDQFVPMGAFCPAFACAFEALPVTEVVTCSQKVNLPWLDALPIVDHDADQLIDFVAYLAALEEPAVPALARTLEDGTVRTLEDGTVRTLEGG